MRIFLIEYDRGCRKLLTDFLVLKGHEVFEYADPTDCQACFQTDVVCLHENSCADILLIDQNMPKMNGLDFIQLQIKLDCKGSARNRALMSANLTRPEIELATQLGCTIFPKPLSLRALLEWIESVKAKQPSEHTLSRQH
jgi:DNA-binding response OmpR family regulator